MVANLGSLLNYNMQYDKKRQVEIFIRFFIE